MSNNIKYTIEINRTLTNPFARRFWRESAKEALQLKRVLVAFDINNECSTKIRFIVWVPSDFHPDSVVLFNDMQELVF